MAELWYTATTKQCIYHPPQLLRIGLVGLNLATPEICTFAASQLSVGVPLSIPSRFSSGGFADGSDGVRTLLVSM